MLHTVQRLQFPQQHGESTILARTRLLRRLLVCLQKWNQTHLTTEAARLTQTMTKTLQL